MEGCPLPDMEHNSAGRVTSLSTAPGPSSIGACMTSTPVSAISRSAHSQRQSSEGYTMKTGGRKTEFMPQAQTFVDVTESTANVNYITSTVQRKWGSQYVLVTSDGLQIEDGSGTQGMY